MTDSKKFSPEASVAGDFRKPQEFYLRNYSSLGIADLARVHNILEGPELNLAARGKNKSLDEILEVLRKKGYGVEKLNNNELKVTLHNPKLVILGEVASFYAAYFRYEKIQRKQKRPIKNQL